MGNFLEEILVVVHLVHLAHPAHLVVRLVHLAWPMEVGNHVEDQILVVGLPEILEGAFHTQDHLGPLDHQDLQGHQGHQDPLGLQAFQMGALVAVQGVAVLLLSFLPTFELTCQLALELKLGHLER